MESIFIIDYLIRETSLDRKRRQRVEGQKSRRFGNARLMGELCSVEELEVG